MGKDMKKQFLGFIFISRRNMAEPRRPSVPIIYTRGTHYEVGYDVVSYTAAFSA